MPYYERTGMISHRHPFYGFGQNPFQTPGPWAPTDEQPDDGYPLPAPPELTSVPTASVGPTPVNVQGAASWTVPLLILGGAVAIFVLTLRKRG
jgi:hypothetical protein